jgi:hypothetical protein
VPVTRIIPATHPTRGTLLAAVDPSARFVEGRVCGSRISAMLAPFRDDESAIAALLDAGAVPEVEQL